MTLAAQHVVAGLAQGNLEIVDLTVPLTADTPVIQLPPPFVNTQHLS